MKALEYQETNFNLNRLNSALLQENEILKHQVEKLEKRIERITSHQGGREEIKPSEELKPDLPRVEYYYR